MRKLALLVALVLVATFCVSSANAAIAPNWYTCTVNQIGSGWGISGSSCGIQLTDTGGTFPASWFFLDPTRANQLLAVALTALSNGKPIYTYIAGDYATVSTIYVQQ